jgi:hypothetical protein
VASCAWTSRRSPKDTGNGPAPAGSPGGAGCAIDGAADYWLGLCEALDGRPEAALRAFARLPKEYPLDSVGAYHEANANLSQGRLHPAERRLQQVLARGGPDLDGVRGLLGHIEQMEVRFDDVKPLLRAHLEAATDPIGDLRELATTTWNGCPTTG